MSPPLKSFIFLGATRFSEALLLHLLAHDLRPQAVFAIPERFHISYSPAPVKNCQYADLAGLARSEGIPCHLVNSLPGRRLGDHADLILDLAPEVILVLGWYYLVPRSIRDLAPLGAWGIHASLLPRYAGGAPLVWAMIQGETQTGVTLFRLADDVDDGDIIAQRTIPIGCRDTIAEVYARATEASKSLLLEAMLNPADLTFTPQDLTQRTVYPQRNPADGQLDLTLPAERLYNAIRAQAAPYPGAFIRTSDGKRLVIEKARIEVDDG